MGQILFSFYYNILLFDEPLIFNLFRKIIIVCLNWFLFSKSEYNIFKFVRYSNMWHHVAHISIILFIIFNCFNSCIIDNIQLLYKVVQCTLIQNIYKKNHISHQIAKVLHLFCMHTSGSNYNRKIECGNWDGIKLENNSVEPICSIVKNLGGNGWNI